MHADDMADACVFLMQNYDGLQHVNIGVGYDISISGLATMIKEIIGYTGEIRYNTDKPDGTPKKLMDVSKLNNLGWQHKIDLKEGIEMVYEEFKKRYEVKSEI
ncbi:MAG: GDP-L-fucose synthase, partial [Bacteroidota bacterium]